MLRFITGALALFALAFLDTHPGAWATGGTDPATFRLTSELLDRMEAVAAELKDLPDVEAQNDDDEDAESVDDIARKMDAHPRVRAALARHKLTSREYVTAALAALHAGMALAVEKAPGAQAPEGFTPEQRANVGLLRARQKARR